MAREKGLANFSANFEPQIATALDARMRVAKLADLTGSSTWQANDGNIYTYTGMFSVVYDDTTNNGIYILNAPDYTDINNWKKNSSITTTTFSELQTLISNSGLTVGSYYNITDYQTVHQFIDDKTAIAEINSGTTEPLIVLATSTNTLDKQAYSPLYPQDIIHYDITGDNRDIAFFNSTVPIDGLKGIITYRKDTTQDVELYYDFRNVKFRRWSVSATTWVSEDSYTAKDVVEYSNIIYKCKITHTGVSTPPNSDTTNWVKWLDCSTNRYWSWTSEPSNFNIGDITTTNLSMNDYVDVYTFGDYYQWVYSISIGMMDLAFLDDNTYLVSRLNNIIFRTIDSYYTCNSNKIGNNSFNNTVVGEYYSNTIGNEYYSNTIGIEYIYNTIGNNCNNNTIGNGYVSNTIGNYYHSNTIDTEYYSNTIGDNYESNTIGNGYVSNTIGNNYYNNTIGDYYQFNTIGDYYQFNTIGNYYYSNTIDTNYFSNTIGDYYQSNTVGDNYYYNTIGNNFGYDSNNSINLGNTIGDHFHTNVIGHDVYSNSIKNNFHHNQIGLITFTYSNLTGSFTIGDTITDGGSKTAEIVSDDGSTMTIRKCIGGGFAVGETLNNGAGATATLDTITYESVMMYSNDIGDNFYENYIGNTFVSNIINNEYNNNIIIGDYENNNIDDYYEYNIIDVYYYNNNIDDEYSYNIIGVSYQYNNVGKYHYSNTIGTHFEFNNIGYKFIFNTINHYCKHNKIGNNFRGYNNSNQNIIGDNFQFNIFEDFSTPTSLGITYGSGFTHNYVKSNAIPEGTNFSDATYVVAAYTKEIYLRSDGTPRLKFDDNNDNTIYKNITE